MYTFEKLFFRTFNLKFTYFCFYLRHEKSRINEVFDLTWTPIMASIGTSVLGMLTECGGKYIGCNMPKLHSVGKYVRQPPWVVIPHHSQRYPSGKHKYI